uniref:Secreted protein n=1 Tax=Panagrellus redivivus TaxID=6233 RepID=A0A7E4UYK4_PANRE
MTTYSVQMAMRAISPAPLLNSISIYVRLEHQTSSGVDCGVVSARTGSDHCVSKSGRVYIYEMIRSGVGPGR